MKQQLEAQLEKQREARELQEMREEERYSKDAEAEARKLDIWKSSAMHAREQLAELEEAREDDAEFAKMLEEGRERARRAQERRRRLEEEQRSNLHDQITLSGDVDGYGFGSDDANKIRNGVNRLVKTCSAFGTEDPALLNYRQVQARYSTYREGGSCVVE